MQQQPRFSSFQPGISIRSKILEYQSDQKYSGTAEDSANEDISRRQLLSSNLSNKPRFCRVLIMCKNNKKKNNNNRQTNKGYLGRGRIWERVNVALSRANVWNNNNMCLDLMTGVMYSMFRGQIQTVVNILYSVFKGRRSEGANCLCLRFKMFEITTSRCLHSPVTLFTCSS